MTSPARVEDRTEPDLAARARLLVWIDQDLCTGDGLCTDEAPDVFVLLEDGIAYVRQGDRVCNDPGMAADPALVPPELDEAVIRSAEACPGECIFIEPAPAA